MTRRRDAATGRRPRLRRIGTVAGVVVLALTTSAAWGFWTADSVSGGYGAARADTLPAGATPTVTPAGSSVTLSWTASTTTVAAGAVSGYLVRRFDAATGTEQTVLSGCTGTRTGLSCTETGVPDGSWRWSITPVLGVSWRGAESVRSAPTLVDATGPTNVVSASPAPGAASVAGTTIYYRGVQAGTTRLSNALVDGGSGPASSGTSALGGASAGFTHAPSTVSTPTGGPYLSAPFSWTAGTTSSPTTTVTGTDAAGRTTPTTYTFTNDSAGPTGASITYLNGAATSTSLSVSFATGTDVAAGVGSWQVQRAIAPLVSGTCGAYGDWIDRGTASAPSPLVETLQSGACYQYRLVVTDRVGNTSTAVSASVVKSTMGTPADVTGPTGGAVDATGLVGTGARFSTSTTLSVAFTPGTDPSGIATTGARLLRATAPLTTGTCGTYAAYAVVVDSPTSPTSDTVADGACYRYRYRVIDTQGNETLYESADIKVDTTAPTTPSLVASAFTNAAASGSTVYYRPGVAGSFTLTASSSDAQSGIASYTFPALGTGWTGGGTSASAARTYSWTASPTAPSASTVTALAGSSMISPGAALQVVADSSLPTGGAVTYTGGYTRAATVSVGFANGTDAGSGIGTRLLQRQTAPLTNGLCGAFGAFATVTGGTDPASSPISDAVSATTCYRYQLLVTDRVGNQTAYVGAGTVMVGRPYNATVVATSGLQGYWRLGESASTVARSSDSFSGAAVTLTGHTGELAGTWTAHGASGTVQAETTAAGRVRKTGTNTAGALYTPSWAPSTADYRVAADVYFASKITRDEAGVVGRVGANNSGTFYQASYDVDVASWRLRKEVNGTVTVLGTWADAPAVGATRRVALDMTGTTIRLLVDGVPRLSATDSAITAAGLAGIVTGTPGGNGGTQTTLTETTGLHLDNFAADTPATATDSAGTNTGTYVGAPSAGVAGALVGDTSTAVTFDGLDDAVTMARQVSGDFSIELWFRSTQGLGTSALWSDGAPLLDADVTGNALDFGVTLRSDGRVVGGVGRGGAQSDISVVSTASGYNDGQWHHVVLTRQQSSGALALYVDGAAAGAATGGTTALTGSATMSLGGRDAQFFAGTLDEVATYTNVLTPAIVTEHYNSR